MKKDKRILGVYKITYFNGVTQIKNLIRHEDYLIIKEMKDKIYEIERNNGFKSTSESISLKDKLLSLNIENYFTDKSPLFYSIETQTLVLPINQGGPQPINIYCINKKKTIFTKKVILFCILSLSLISLGLFYFFN